MSWQDDAACRGMSPHWFFPERGDEGAVTIARRVCAGCPVAVECFDANRHERDGIYAGTTGRQRRTMRAGSRQAPEMRERSVALSREGLTDSAVAWRLGITQRMAESYRRQAGIHRGPAGRPLEGSDR